VFRPVRFPSHLNWSCQTRRAVRCRCVTGLIFGLALIVLARTGQAQSAAAVTLTIDSPYLDMTYNDEGDEVRWLSVFVTIDNQTDAALRIPPNAWQLRDSRQTLTPAPITQAFTSREVVSGNELVSLATFRPSAVDVAPKTQQRVGLFFQPLAVALRNPDLELTLTVNERQLEKIDVAQTANDSLKISSRRIGPARAIAFLRISGELNSLNAGLLVRELDELSGNDRVLRFVIELDAEMRIPDPGVLAWLRLVARHAGHGEIQSPRFAQIPSEILAVQLTQSQPTDNEQPRFDRLQAEHYDNVHGTLESAIEAAVIPLCERLPREILLAELRDGEAVSRQVVLRHCGERLVDEDLPLILGFLKSEHKSLRLAALETLRHFETPAAVTALATASQSDDEETAIAALSAMATSRYGSVRDRLLALLETADTKQRLRVTDTLARHPHSDWASRLLELADDADVEIRRAALTGLIALGHPQLDRLLRKGLNSDDEAIQRLSLRYLMSSRDSENEKLAFESVLKQLETTPPSRAVTLFLKRVRDRRATPAVRRWLKSETPRIRRRVVQIMLVTGDPSVLDELVGEFNSLGPGEQVEILNALYSASSPDFWKLAPQSLHSKRGQLFEATAELLRRDGSDRAVTLLADALSDKVLAESRRSLTVCQTLAAIATPTARNVLIDHVRDDSETLSTASVAALQQLYLRSPAMPLLARGAMHMEPGTGQYNPTLAMMYFNLAVETDPDHPSSRLSRADVVLKDDAPSQQELEATREDLRVALRLDPSSTNALTCLGLTEVRLGAIDTGIRIVEDERDRFAGDALYHYNTACIYGRAIESLEAQLKSQSPPSEELRKTIERYRAQAVADLRQSIENGLDDHNRDWMREDPDLATIRQSPDFEKLFEDEVTLPPIPNELK
jgi:HEAT repeat protein